MGPLSGFTVGVTADRRASEQMQLLTGRGATCIHGPVIKTHPIGPQDELRAATEAVIAKPVDIVLLTTGIGVRGWLEAADALVLGESLRTVLESARLFARGPKATGAAVTAGLQVEWNAPNARSDELIEALSGESLEGRRVAVQLDGAAGAKLGDAVQAMGADVVPVPIYRWSLPDDLGPAERLIRAVCDGRVDAITFTTRPAVDNLMEIASELGRHDELLSALARDVFVLCVGPVCAAGAVDARIATVHQPERARLGSMIQYLANAFSDRAATVELAGVPVRCQGRRVQVGDGEPFMLTDRERGVLGALTERPGVVLSKRELLRRVWGGNESDEHVVEVTVGRLRQRLGPAGVGVETVVRRGYRVSSA